MGSQTNDNTEQQPLPDAASAALVLTHPTEGEMRQTWTLNHREWGGALSLEQYLRREPYLAAAPLARDGGMTHWILTTSTDTTTADTAEPRPVLASCESIRKRVLVARPAARRGVETEAESEVEIQDGVGYGVGSVYTYPEYRGRSYASRMLKELGVALRTLPSQQQPRRNEQGERAVVNGGGEEEGPAAEKEAACSALWSDLGKVFYAKKGWPPFPSAHATFSAAAATTSTTPTASNGPQHNGNGTTPLLPTEPITRENLARFAAQDEAQLRRRLARTASRTRRPAFAFAPDEDTFLWHLARETFISAQVFGNSSISNDNKNENGDKTEAVINGLAAGPEGRRVWAVWARNYYAGPEEPGKNTLFILRLVVEGADEDREELPPSNERRDELRAAFAAVVGAARDVAARWGLARVDLWNPTPLVRGLLRDVAAEAPHDWVERDMDSIPSLMWYGDEPEEDVEWVANEKYCWC